MMKARRQSWSRADYVADAPYGADLWSGTIRRRPPFAYLLALRVVAITDPTGSDQ